MCVFCLCVRKTVRDRKVIIGWWYCTSAKLQNIKSEHPGLAESPSSPFCSCCSKIEQLQTYHCPLMRNFSQMVWWLTWKMIRWEKKVPKQNPEYLHSRNEYKSADGWYMCTFKKKIEQPLLSKCGPMFWRNKTRKDECGNRSLVPWYS